jgi:putative ABC transport system permease protein
MNLVGLALRNLRRRPVRTCLSILGVGLAVGSALALIALSRSIKDSTREGMDEMGDDLVVMQKGASDIFGGFIPEQMVERVAAIQGVVRVSGELFMFAPSAGDHSVLTLGWPETSYLWKKVPLREGRVPGPAERHVAVLGEGAAASLGRKLGDELELLGETFRVIGIANYTTIVNRGIVLVPLIDLQEASYRSRQVTMIHVNVERSGGPAELARVRTSIEALSNVTASTANEVLNNDRNFAILEAVSLAVSIIAVAIGALNVLTALVMATQERTREIGIFAAIGWSSTRIITSIVIEGRPDVRDRLHPGRAVEFCRRLRLSAHTGDRPTDLVQAKRRGNRADPACGRRALHCRLAVARLARRAAHSGGCASAHVRPLSGSRS